MNQISKKLLLAGILSGMVFHAPLYGHAMTESGAGRENAPPVKAAGEAAQLAEEKTLIIEKDGEDNLLVYIDGKPVMGKTDHPDHEVSTGNRVFGEGGKLLSASHNLVFGDDTSIVNSSDMVIFGDGNRIEDAEGSGNVYPDSSGTLVFGNKNIIESSKNSIVIGNGHTLMGKSGQNMIIGAQIRSAFYEDGKDIGKVARIEGSIGFGSDIRMIYDTENGITENVQIEHVVAVGNGVTIHNENAVGIGSTVNSAENSVAIGYNVSTYNTKNPTESGKFGAVAIGENLEALGANSIAIGKSIKAHSVMAVGIGYGNTIEGDSGIVIGNSSSIKGEMSAYGIVMGESASITNSVNSMAIGSASKIGKGSDDSVALGYSAKIVSGEDNVALGNSAYIASGDGNTVVGKGAQKSGAGEQGSAFGYYAKAKAGYATAMGAYAEAGATQSTALGYYANVSKEAANSIAIGSKSTVNANDILDQENVKAWLDGQDAAYKAYAAFNIDRGDASGVFSVGSTGKSARRIINVARGRISADSTDAVNGSQLFGAVQYLEGKISNLSGGGNVDIEGDDNITVTPSVTTDPDSGKDKQHFDVNLNNEVTLGGTNEETGKFENGALTVTGEGKDGNSHTVTIHGDTGTMDGLSNTAWDGKAYLDGQYKNSSNAATEAQLHEGLAGTVQYDRKDDGTVNTGDIYLDAGGTTIHNVAAGKADMDAVNVSQLKDVEMKVDNNTTAISHMSGQIHKMDRKIDRVGAGAAALAALHPLDFDPDDKWDFAAGYGNYGSASAAAVGAFYRPNEDTMISFGASLGNGENMVNAGVSWKMGQGSHVSTSKVAMAKEIKDLREEIELLKSVILEMHEKETKAALRPVLPDMPEYHWVYAYMQGLAEQGLAKERPGLYGRGAPAMTRDEAARFLCEAMENGAELSDAVKKEFAAELGRYTVDVIETDSEGEPDIERVRTM